MGLSFLNSKLGLKQSCLIVFLLVHTQKMLHAIRLRLNEFHKVNQQVPVHQSPYQNHRLLTPSQEPTQAIIQSLHPQPPDFQHHRFGILPALELSVMERNALNLPVLLSCFFCLPWWNSSMFLHVSTVFHVTSMWHSIIESQLINSDIDEYTLFPVWNNSR